MPSTYSLVFQRYRSEWKIVHVHSGSNPLPGPIADARATYRINSGRTFRLRARTGRTRLSRRPTLFRDSAAARALVRSDHGFAERVSRETSGAGGHFNSEGRI